MQLCVQTSYMFRLYTATIRLSIGFLYNFIQLYVNVRRDFVRTILLHCVIVLLFTVQCSANGGYV
jgi:hypothetical protein